MAIQTINIGNRVNDGLGDDLRTAFEKVNANFTELEQQIAITGKNVGTTGAGFFKQKVGQDLEFKKLVAGTKLVINEFDEVVVIDNTEPDSFTRFDTDSGSISASTHDEITIQGRFAPGSYTKQKDIEVTAQGSNIYIKTQIPVKEILENYDFGFINGNFTNAVQFALASSNVDFGTLSYKSSLSLDCGSIL